MRPRSTSLTVYYYNAATSVSITTATSAAISNWTTQGWRADTTAGAKTYSLTTAINFSASSTLYGVYTEKYPYAIKFYGASDNNLYNYCNNEDAPPTLVEQVDLYYNSNQSALPTKLSIEISSETDTSYISRLSYWILDKIRL